MSEQTSLPDAPPSVFDFILASVEQYSSLAWQRMGLQPDLLTGKIHRDLSEAKVAIDLTTHLASFIEPLLEDDEDKKRIHNLIRDLRLNYVEQSKRP